MKCPVCEADAQDITVKTFDGVSIRCNSCGDYDISGTTYDTGLFAKLDPEERVAALMRAQRRAPLGTRPMIMSIDVS